MNLNLPLALQMSRLWWPLPSHWPVWAPSPPFLLYLRKPRGLSSCFVEQNSARVQIYDLARTTPSFKFVFLFVLKRWCSFTYYCVHLNLNERPSRAQLWWERRWRWRWKSEALAQIPKSPASSTMFLWSIFTYACLWYEREGRCLYTPSHNELWACSVQIKL